MLNPVNLATHGALRTYVRRTAATVLPGVEVPPVLTETNGRIGLKPHYERMRWVLSKGRGDEEKAARSSSLLMITSGNSETRVGSERVPEFVHFKLEVDASSCPAIVRKHEVVAY